MNMALHHIVSDKNPSNPTPPTADCPPANILPEDTLFEQLIGILNEQKRPATDITKVSEAFDYARKMHEGQYRKNNDNYIVHPVSVAIFLANMPADTPTIISALLHDVIEDTPATPEEVKKRFGEEVLRMVEAVTKLGKFEFSSKEDQQAENFRKMFLAMADDVRVILLKLSDRLHNMQTLCHMKPEKQLKIASETLEIFAPLANRMGMGKLRAELEDLSLKYLDPDKYQLIDAEIAETQDQWEKTIQIVMDKIKSQLSESHAGNTKIYGRVKNYYSIYKKMQTRQKAVQEIYDLSAVRVLVNSEKECYEVLGIIHSAFKPIPGRFKDYIAMPKSNLYQSLHTTVIGPFGQPLEVQIRTYEMHRVAEYGIAAHWKYKEGGSKEKESDEQKLLWLRQMVEMKDETGNAKEYVDSIKLDLFRDEVFVFTPKGKVVVLPKESTPVDFAYRIHTEVGNTCTGAMVNGKIVPLNYVLKNGDFVEIHTSKKSSPRLDWINFVQTQQAKSRIRLWYKKHFKDEHEDQGRRTLEEHFTRAVLDEMTKDGTLLALAKSLNYDTIEDLFVALGYGETNLQRILHRVTALRIKKADVPNLNGDSASLTELKARIFKPAAKTVGADDIQGLEGMLYHLAKCCNPLPGELIVGVVTRSRGVMVHREDCPNLGQANENRLMSVSWGASVEDQKNRTQSVKLDVHVIDRVGVLKDILGKISDHRTNLSNTKVQLFPDHSALIEVTVDIQNLQHLERIRQAIMQVNDVISVKRQAPQSLTKGAERKV